MSNGAVMELECPECFEWIECDDHQVMVTCLGCQIEYLIESDGEIIDGIWHCHSKLIQQKKKE